MPGAFLLVVSALPAAAQACQDIRIWTYEGDGSGAANDACYELVGYSNLGRDENSDSQVAFENIPLGDDTLHQVTSSAGSQRIVDYTLSVSWWMPNDFLGLVVRQAPKQTNGTTDHVSLVFLDVTTLERVAPPDIPAGLVGGLLVGCEDSLLDGQVDFLAVENGEYELRIHSQPDGYALTYPDAIVSVYGTDANTTWYVFLSHVE